MSNIEADPVTPTDPPEGQGGGTNPSTDSPTTNPQSTDPPEGQGGGTT